MQLVDAGFVFRLRKGSGVSPARFPLLRAVIARAIDLLSTLADADAVEAGAPPHPLAFPLMTAGFLLGLTLLLAALDMPRAAIVALVLSLIVVLAILRELILTGDR